MKKWCNIIVPTFICLLIGSTAKYFQSDSLRTWYPYLHKSILSPPNIAFPIAWGIIYLCMGISIGLIFNSKGLQKKSAVFYFCIQLFFNFTWSISFFYFQNPLLGLINIILLDCAVLIFTFKCYSIQKISAWLFFPYIIWLGLATYLNCYIVIYN